MISRTLGAALFAATALAAAPALAEDGDAIATAPASPSALQTPGEAAAPAPAAKPAAQDVGQQIADYLATSPAAKLPPEGASGVISGAEEPDRQVHGVASVSVGSHGYRSVYLRSDMPLGKTGQLSIAVQDSRGRGWYGPGYRRSLGVGFAFGDGLASSWRDRCRGWRYGDPTPPPELECRTAPRAPDL